MNSPPHLVAFVHAVELASRANGPGARMVVWLQGCSLGCAGCFNPTTHAPAANDAGVPVDDLLARLSATPTSTGLTLSGGEPFEQPMAAAALLAGARALGRSTLVFSGYTEEELRARGDGEALLANLDVLIDGRYVAPKRLATGLRGSANQRIRLLTARYSRADVEATPVAEIRIDSRGDAFFTGVSPLHLKRR